MARTAKITLDGKDYEIKAFNLGELEEVTDIFQSAKPSSVPFKVLAKALGKIDVPIVSVDATLDEVTAAFRAIMELSGMKVPDGTDPSKGAEVKPV